MGSLEEVNISIEVLSESIAKLNAAIEKTMRLRFATYPRIPRRLKKRLKTNYQVWRQAASRRIYTDAGVSVVQYVRTGRHIAIVASQVAVIVTTAYRRAQQINAITFKTYLLEYVPVHLIKIRRSAVTHYRRSSERSTRRVIEEQAARPLDAGIPHSYRTFSAAYPGFLSGAIPQGSGNVDSAVLPAVRLSDKSSFRPFPVVGLP